MAVWYQCRTVEAKAAASLMEAARPNRPTNMEAGRAATAFMIGPHLNTQFNVVREIEKYAIDDDGSDVSVKQLQHCIMPTVL